MIINLKIVGIPRMLVIILLISFSFSRGAGAGCDQVPSCDSLISLQPGSSGSYGPNPGGIENTGDDINTKKRSHKRRRKVRPPRTGK